MMNFVRWVKRVMASEFVSSVKNGRKKFKKQHIGKMTGINQGPENGLNSRKIGS